METGSWKYQRNITVNYLFVIITNLDLTRGLWMIYLALRGFTLLQLGILEGLFHVTSFLMEVPTGAIADLWGRKISRLAGRAAFLLSLILMYYAESFSLQLAGFAVCALGYNLESGSGDALLYDSLLLDKREQGYMKINGRKELFLQAAMITAYVLGGYLAVRSYFLLFHISMLIAAASLITGLLFLEPEISTENKPSPEKERLLRAMLNSITGQFTSSVRIIRDRPRIALLIIFSELLFTFMTCLYFYLQNFWKNNGRSEFSIGLIFAVSALLSGVFGFRTASIEKKIGERGVLLSMPLLLLFCLWGVALSPWKGFFFAVTGVIEGILIVAISDYLNRLIPSGNRATILSFQSMTFSFFMIILFPAVGLIGDAFSLETAFISIAAFGSLLSILYFFTMGKKRRK